VFIALKLGAPVEVKEAKGVIRLIRKEMVITVNGVVVIPVWEVIALVSEE
jgi:hypothetical protein